MPTLLQEDDSTAGQAPLSTDPHAPGPAIDVPPTNLSILPAGLSDAPAEKDSLGFEYYVSAIKEFLVSPYTKAPLTLSIEGPWGSGKSSFMIQLRNQIAPELEGSPKRDQRRKRQPGSPPIVEFNAWRHDKQEALWAAFALSFIEQISTQCSFWKRVSGSIRLFASRFDLRGGWLPAVRALAITITLIACFFAIPILMFTRGLDWSTDVAHTLSQYPSAKDRGETEKKEKRQESKQLSTGQAEKENNLSDNDSKKEPPAGSEAAFKALQPIINAGGLTGSVTLFLYLLYSVARILGNPFEVNLRKHVRSPDYEGSIAFIENFQRDFNRILDAYVGKLKPDLTDEQLNKLKTFVFIDDLDRCELPKAAELMNAINLLISGDQRLIFVIGMDRQKVAAAVASKYKDLVPFLQNETPYTKEDSTQVKQPNQAIAFGYSFLEKFIQLPFSVPAPNRLDDFLESISQSVKSHDGENVTDSKAKTASELERSLQARLADPDSPNSGEAPGPILLNPEFSLGDVKLESVLRVMPVRIRSNLGPAQLQARHLLAQLARQYAETRDSMVASDQRTIKMNEIFDEIVKAQSVASLTDEEIGRLFSQSVGDRIAGLAAVSLQNDARFSNFIFSCIADPKSYFEQYHALLIADVMLNRGLSPDQLRQLKNALKKAVGTTIRKNDQSRWIPAQKMLSQLSVPLDKEGHPFAPAS